MNPETIARALPSIGLVATMGLFLPSLDEAWRTDPREPSLYHVKLRRGETLYVGMGVTILTLASYANRSTFPLLIGGAFMLATVMTYEQAFRAVPAAAKKAAE
jgi:hypothetical protein